MSGRVWNVQEKLLGGRVFGELFNLVGLVSASIALAVDIKRASSGDNTAAVPVEQASLWLAVLAGVAVLIAGVSVVYNAARIMETNSDDARKARKLAFGRGFLWIFLAGGAALAAGVIGLAGGPTLAVGMVGFFSLLGWAVGEGLNIGQQVVGRRVEPDAMLKFRSILDAIFSAAKAVGIVLMCIGVFLPIAPKAGLLITGAVVAGLGALLNLLMGVFKLMLRRQS